MLLVVTRSVWFMRMMLDVGAINGYKHALELYTVVEIFILKLEDVRLMSHSPVSTTVFLRKNLAAKKGLTTSWGASDRNSDLLPRKALPGYHLLYHPVWQKNFRLFFRFRLTYSQISRAFLLTKVDQKDDNHREKDGGNEKVVSNELADLDSDLFDIVHR